MKKTYLLLLAILPIFGSCNKNSGFANPFPNDTYNKIGFKFDNNEQIVRQLTTNETELVKSIVTEAGAAKNDAKVFYKESEIHTRDYTKAFAGEFKQGYNVSNVMKDETIVVKRQDEIAGEGTAFTNRTRTLKTSKSTQISNYSYGNIEEELTVNEYVYYYKADSSDNKESDTKENSSSLNIRTQKIENGKYEKTTDEKKVDKGASYTDDEINKYFHIHQSDYIYNPDLKSGADNKNNIILVKSSQKQHVDTETKKEGIFTLKDGRAYQAMDNSLVVTKLKVEGESEKYCVASYVRIYSETVITSEVIQPNVPVTKLSNPITISYTEEKIFHGEKDKEGKQPSIDGKIPEEK